ncbi:MAG TPA: response regulator [Deltaproteobacteria bacterium]|jgi:CheY-like chemotaxis protein|nr:response regulator [Deltaproteobacteria bacterium]HQI02633.1 response regulator [Deltaproteobacteria bacterium]HQJ08224.1 response regulator [Deltaproteobacteria bacterium]
MDSKKKVLLIDDDKDFLMATKLILEKGGYEVFLAEDGKSGVEMAKSVNPNLAIVDMMMETWSEGFNVVSKLRTSETGKQIPLIMLSAVDLQGPYQSFEPPEDLPTVDLVLHKPIKADDLLRYVGQLVG